MTSPSPYKTNPYKRRFQKKDTTDEEATETAPDSEESETTKPVRPSSFSTVSSDAIKRRLAKDKYNVG